MVVCVCAASGESWDTATTSFSLYSSRTTILACLRRVGRRAAAQVGAAGFQDRAVDIGLDERRGGDRARRILQRRRRVRGRRGGRCRVEAGALLDQRQLHFFDRHDLVGDRIEFFEDLHRAFGVVAADDEFFTAAENRHVQRRRNLAQVFVERAAQVRQARVVDRLGNEIGRLGRGFGFQWDHGVRGRTSAQAIV